VNPEEVPIISDVINDSDKGQCKPETTEIICPKVEACELDQPIESDDDEVQPENYFFSNDS